jgi:hypothetical protein
MPAGTYRINVGPLFYFGSTTDMERRMHDHRWRLRTGRHPVPRLQEAFSAGQDFTFTPIEVVHPFSQEPRAKFNHRLRAKEQKLLSQHKKDPNLCNRSTNTRGPDSTIAKERWNVPGYREKVIAGLANRPPPPEQTRAKMAKAKVGDRNPRSRAVIVTHPDGSTTRHESTALAACFFRVTQQCLDQWLKGETAWPGTGRTTRAKNRWIIPYRAAFEDMPSSPRTFSTVG